MSLAAVKKAAATLGASVADDVIGFTHECRVEAPRGKIWVDGGVHELVEASHMPFKPDYADILDRIAHGLEDCTNPACDWCNPIDDDPA
jgi:hypothetical protein